MRNRVREMRLARGWSQTDLATKVGVSRQALGAIENGVWNPSLVTIQSLLEVFGVQFTDLFYPEQEEPTIETGVSEVQK